MLTQSRYVQAHKKLGDLYQHWKHADRLLAPAIQFLPQLLIVPVILFIVGLLDNVISSAIPLSRPYTSIFGAGILAAIFALSVCAYTIGTVLHGCLYPDISPFQSRISQVLSLKVPLLFARIKNHSSGMYYLVDDGLSEIQKHLYKFTLISKLRYAYNYSVFRFQSFMTELWTRICDSSSVDHIQKVYQSLLNKMTVLHNKIIKSPLYIGNGSPSESYTQAVWQNKLTSALEAHDFEAYHDTLVVVHEDDIIDQSVTIYHGLFKEQLPKLKGIFKDRLYKVPMASQVNSLIYMLSEEVSIRTNMTATAFVQYQFTYTPGKLKQTNC